jgi:hypothetical protein
MKSCICENEIEREAERGRERGRERGDEEELLTTSWRGPPIH